MRTRRSSALLILPALLALAGCGGSGIDDPVESRLTLAADSAFNGDAADIIGDGVALFSADPENPGAVVSFGSGTRLIDVSLPTIDPGTYQFEELSGAQNTAFANYYEDPEEDIRAWTTGTEGSVTISGSGETRRFTFRNVRFTGDSDGDEGSFVLSGTATARLVEDEGGTLDRRRGNRR